MVESKQQATCPQCDAPFDVPETGLMMTCAFCGHRMAVPDADERRAALETEREEAREEAEAERERQARADERAAEERRRADREQLKHRRQRRAALRRGLVRAVVLLMILGGFAYGAERAGGLDYWLGDAGDAYYGSADYQTRNEGYTRFAGPTRRGITRLPVTLGDDNLYSLSAQYCYALVAVSGAPIRAARLLDPQDRPVQASDQRAYVHTLRYCPEHDGLYALALTADGLTARATVGAYYRPKPAGGQKKRKAGKRR